MALHQYSYQACDINGKILSGQLSAETEQEVVNSLQNRQLIPLKVEQQADPHTQGLFQQRVTNRDIIDFTNGLCTLVEAHVPMDRALALLENINAKPLMQQLIADLRQSVKEGKSLADALQAYPHYFSRMYINMVHAGEEGGILDRLLPKLAHFMTSADTAKRTVISSLIYPMILAVVGLLSVILLLVYVVPQFATMFDNMGTAIPPAAALLLNISQWLKIWGWLLIPLPFLLIYAWKLLDKQEETRLQRDQFLLSTPLLGGLLLEAESSRFCRTLGSLLGAGIPLLKSLHIVRGVIENQVLNHTIAHAEEAVRGGTSLGKALSNEGTFPVLLSQLIIVGEESGRTADILEKLAETFDASVTQKTSRLVALAEPALIVLMGVLVGTIVIVMLSAVFSINQLQY
ncbi:type II secretion system F family protein [Thioflexithrix psekupsensis]|uniref:Type II secretion system protein GspF domain-containing protein n=1 Tax=Thioflexithrix psekupsensis TaxID=1570016 RepID=A0A251X6G3_9GAMM|nr:type II secretion system F family protein [Thioflexithrix psekupsensis]OUD13187.1 hypothetical protein TPSD3_11130 [Thioflexithrix psekupsensis]